MIVQEPVQAAIWHCLNSYDYDDAIFLSERLHVEVSSNESMYLLASAYHRTGETAHANYLLRVHGPRTPKLRHLHAVTAFKLGRLQEAETLLIGGLCSIQYSREAIANYLAATLPPCNTRLCSILQETASSGYGVYGSFVLKLLGDVFCRTQRPMKACIAYRAALAINPFLFTVYLKLMDTYPGEKAERSSCSSNNNNNASTPLDTDPNNIFSLDKLSNLCECHGNTLCSVLNNADARVESSCVGVNSTSGNANRVISLGTGGSTGSLSQYTTPANNVVMNHNQLFTPVGLPGINLIITPSPAPQQHSQENHTNANVFQAPRKKRIPTVQSNSGSGGQILQPQRILMTPETPSFGILPVEQQQNSTISDYSSTDSSFASAVNNSHSVALLSPLVFSPLETSMQHPPQIMSNAPKVSNASSFSLARRVLCRSSSNNTTAGTQAVTASAVSTVTTPAVSATVSYHSPSSSHTNVRRSSRLFGSASSVKENSKSRVFAAPKSPPVRRVKPRALRPSVSASTTTPISNATPSTSTPSSSSSLTEINNARNTTNSLALSGGVGGENIMPGDSNILTSSTAENKTTAAPDKELKPAVPAQQPVVMLKQEELCKQATVIQKQAADGLMFLFRCLGSAYRLLSRYKCSSSIEAFQSVPAHHLDTPFVLCCLAKAHFYSNDFLTSAKYFQRVMRTSPYLVNELEYYSTALWHLQKEVQLSALAQELISTSKNRAAGWCAVGNCFSLQKEHESAIKFFSRAVQVEPDCAYAYTLLGHEHIATEELERAMGCYRTAVRLSPRHYNAWYGIGRVHYKQENYASAELNFRKALSINPDCCVLLCHIAVVQHKMEKSNAALQTLTRALTLEPNNAMSRYHRAHIYLELNQPESSLIDLHILQPLVPKEANVYLLMGKAYQKIGEVHMAQMNFSWALDLDPKGAASAGAGSGARDDLGGGGGVATSGLESPTYIPADDDVSLDDVGGGEGSDVGQSVAVPSSSQDSL